MVSRELFIRSASVWLDSNTEKLVFQGQWQAVLFSLTLMFKEFPHLGAFKKKCVCIFITFGHCDDVLFWNA